MNQAHVAAIESKHARLEDRIAQEMTRPAPDEVLVSDLKRRKLSLKDSAERARAG